MFHKIIDANQLDMELKLTTHPIIGWLSTFAQENIKGIHWNIGIH